MEAYLHKFQHLKIQLEEIISATNNFDDKENFIGVGGFGRVYKGEVSHSERRSVVAIKRLDRRHGQGEAEFLKEIDTLSRYRHENLISLLGFCYQGDEAILVYEFASHVSLDRHLNSAHLTWSQRLNICLGAAKGLRHLHDPMGTHQRLIHCDVKGGNILLDDKWNAKVADFGFSIMGPANEKQSTIITLAAGTHGYIDPLYLMTNTITKESDIYSFGVVLFEVLCGRLCYTYSDGRVQSLVPKWKECYKEKKLNDIIFKDPTIEPLEQSALNIFSDIAYRCLKESREDRPEMAEVVTELESALESQEFLESQELSENREFKGSWNKHRSYYENISKSAEPPLNYRSEVELKKLLSKEVLLNGGKTWFSLNKKGEHCEMISIVECLGLEFNKVSWRDEKSRFPKGTYYLWEGKFKTHVKTQFLSHGITYTVNLVFKFGDASHPEVRNCRLLALKYKLQGETETSVAHLAYERGDGWWMCELYQFTCDKGFVHLQILFNDFHPETSIEAEGIEFRPLEKMEHKEDEKQPISYSDSASDANWEQKLPTDYEDILKRSTDSVQWTTKEEAYSIMRKGYLISDDKGRSIWFSLGENGKKCQLVSAAHALSPWHKKKLMTFPESRFGEAVQFDSRETLVAETEVQSQLVSPEATYGIYLVYKFQKDKSEFEAPMLVEDKTYMGPGHNNYWYIYLVSPQTPFIKRKADQSTHNPTNRPKIEDGLPHHRNDGWLEVQIWEFQTSTTNEKIRMNLRLTSCSTNMKKFSGLIIDGVEFRPI